MQATLRYSTVSEKILRRGNGDGNDKQTLPVNEKNGDDI